MKKAMKGAFAAAAAGSLMLGGAGSLAYWTGTRDVTGGSIASGKLTLTAPVCNATTDEDTHDWQYEVTDTPFVLASATIVPGDTITKVCKMTLTLTGDHIGAELDLDEAVVTDDANAAQTLDSELDPTATFTVDGAPYEEITAAGTYVVLATITVDFPIGVEANGSQDVAAVLESTTLTATQTHDTAA
jgi:alternate signal-mediated exported protein